MTSRKTFAIVALLIAVTAITSVIGSLAYFGVLQLSTGKTALSGCQALSVSLSYSTVLSATELNVTNIGSQTLTTTPYIVGSSSAIEFSQHIISPGQTTHDTRNLSSGTWNVEGYVQENGQSQKVYCTYSLTLRNAILCCENLELDSSSFDSGGTNVTLYLREIGNITATLTTYGVKDTSGNQYARTSWNGPSIAPNQLAVTVIAIGASCSSCILTGSAFTFQGGQSYMITVVTSQNKQYAFNLTR